VTTALSAGLRPAFRGRLDDAQRAWARLDGTPGDHPDHTSALSDWTASCLRLVTAISSRAEAEALDGLDGRSTDDWIRYLLSFGLPQD
jgi:hypothetical protein